MPLTLASAQCLGDWPLVNVPHKPTGHRRSPRERQHGSACRLPQDSCKDAAEDVLGDEWEKQRRWAMAGPGLKGIFLSKC